MLRLIIKVEHPYNKLFVKPIEQISFCYDANKSGAKLQFKYFTLKIYKNIAKFKGNFLTEFSFLLAKIKIKNKNNPIQNSCMIVSGKAYDFINLRVIEEFELKTNSTA